VRSPSTAVLRVEGACRRYGDAVALEDVDLTIGGGEVYVLLGRNGAGKSTLAKAAIGALALDHGTVRVMDADPSRDPAARRAIGVAPQDIALFPHLTVAENVAAFATLAGVRAGLREAVDAAMRDTDCLARAHQRIDQLSGGWRRRANLAAAIVHRPRLLVLDEPTEGLDPESRAVLGALIADLRSRRTAVLLISHATEEAASLADRVGVLDKGRLVAEGRPADLLTRAFGARQEIVVRLATPSGPGAALLAARGLKSADGDLTWRALADEAPALGLDIDRALRLSGVPIRELAIRPPGLDALIVWAEGAPRP
jgi:ABC-2 type transport system ATP-binding protein